MHTAHRPPRSGPLAGLLLALLLLALLLLALPLRAPAQQAAPREVGPAAPSGVFYEIFVRAFHDSNGDGIGDLRGITEKLPYLKRLGVSGIWLMPIAASPSYHGYDVTDYRAINPQYGTLADFHALVRAAHAEGMRVIVDLVANHSSNENPWFIAAQNPASPYHDWYIWARPGTNLDEVSPWGGRIWHRLHTRWGTQYYMGIFDPHMPDLNYDNPAVRAAMIAIGRYWLQQGADGFRLDAAKHIYDKLDRDDHDPAVIARGVAWWQQFRDGIATTNAQAYLVGEVSGNHTRYLAPFVKPLDAVFDFPLARVLLRSLQSGQDEDIGGELVNIQQQYRAAAGHYVMDAPFLSNHDQPRIMSVLHGNVAQMKLAAALLLTLPGNPYLYYGEEIGMRGSKPDPRIRQPMRWQRSTRAVGESTWEPVAADNRGVSVQAEQDDPHSLLNRYRELIGWRMHIAPLRDGIAGEYASGIPALAAWRLRDAHGSVLVAHNLSAQEQTLPLRAVEHLQYTTLLRHTRGGTRITAAGLILPAYGSAVLLGTPVNTGVSKP